MENSKLITIFKGLTEAERKELSKYLVPPFFNGNQSARRLYRYICRLAPDFEKQKLAKKRVFKRVVGRLTTYKDSKMRAIMHDLTEAIENYLVYKAFSEDKIKPSIYLLSRYKQSNLTGVFEKEIKKTQKKHIEYPFQDNHFFYNQFAIASEQTEFLERAHQRDNEPNLQQLSDSLDYFFLFHKLKYFCKMLNFQNLVQTNFDYCFLKEIKQLLTQNERWQEYPISIGIYYFAFLSLLEGEDDSHFEQFLRLLQEHADILALTDKQELYAIARNYCIKGKRRLDEKERLHYSKLLLKLYKEEVRQGIILEDGLFPPHDYKNIVAIGLQEEDFDWVKNFMEDNQKLLSNEFRESIYSFCMALYYLHQQQFAQARDLLIPIQQARTSDRFLNYDIRVMLAYCYYELEQDKMLNALLKNVRRLIERDLNSQNFLRGIQHYQHFISFLEEIQYLNNLPEPTQKQLDSLESKINNTHRVRNKAWLLEKIEEISNKTGDWRK